MPVCCCEGGEGILAGVPDGGRHGGGGAAAAAAAGEGEVRVADFHLDLRGLESEGLRRHEGHDGARAGAEILRAAADFHGAVGVDLRLGLAAFAAAAPTARRDADAGLDRAGAGAGLFIFGGPTEFVATDFVFSLADFVRVVAQPEFERVQADLHGEVVHHRFGAEGGGRMAGGTEGARRAGVHDHAVLLHAAVGEMIEIGRGDARAAATARAFAAAADAGRAVVGDVGGDELAVLVRGEFELLDGGGAVADGEALVEAREHDLDGRAGGLGELGGQLVVIARAEFRAETAAHVIADYFDVGLRKVEETGQAFPHAEDALGGGPRLDLVALDGDGAAVGFERMMKLDRRAQFGLDDERGGGHGGIDLAVFLDAGRADVGAVVEDLGRAGLHRVVFLHDEGKRRGLDDDGAEGVLALLLGGGGDAGEFLPVEANGALLALGENSGLHAGHGSGLGEVDAGDLGSGPFGAQDHAVEPAVGLHVVGVFGRAGDFCRAVNARGGFAHDLSGTGPRRGFRWWRRRRLRDRLGLRRLHRRRVGAKRRHI